MAQATTCSCCTAPATELKTLSPCSIFTAPRNNEPVIKKMDGQLQQMTDGSAGSVSKGTHLAHLGFSKLEEDRFSINSQHSKPQQGRIVVFFCLICK